MQIYSFSKHYCKLPEKKLCKGFINKGLGG